MTQTTVEINHRRAHGQCVVSWRCCTIAVCTPRVTQDG